MRLIALLCLFPLPALGWSFSPDPICTLSHQTDAADITITYDANLPEYALIIELRSVLWPVTPSFDMVFLGSNRLHIGTTQHQLSDDRTTLTVRDSGFGNVLDGLEFGAVGVARADRFMVQLDLDDAPAAVQAFRACPTDPSATS